jgi:AraC-like DNA-binding protein
VLRFQRVLRSIRNSQEVNWSALATEHGYSDQAHFVHDFRDLSGMTPTAYRPRSADEQNHVPLAATAR